MAQIKLGQFLHKTTTAAVTAENPLHVQQSGTKAVFLDYDREVVTHSANLGLSGSPGSPIPAGESVTILDVSGSGKLYALLVNLRFSFFGHRVHLLRDGNAIYDGEGSSVRWDKDRLDALGLNIGDTVDGISYKKANANGNLYEMVCSDVAEFKESILLELVNSHDTESMEAAALVKYGVLGSPKVVIEGKSTISAGDLRDVLADLKGTVEQYTVSRKPAETVVWYRSGLSESDVIGAINQYMEPVEELTQ